MGPYSHIQVLSIIFLIFAATTSGMLLLLQRLGKMQTREELKKQGLRLFPRLLHYLAKGNEWDMLLFSMHFGKLLFYVLFAATFSSSLRAVFSKQEIVYSEMLSPLLLSVLAALFFDFFMQLCCVKNPKFWLKFLSGPSSAILTVTAPITIPLSALAVRFFPKKTELKLSSSYRIHDKLLEWIKDSDVDSLLEKNEKKLIYAVFSFKDRIAREVMVPRIRVFSLSSDSTIFEAAESFLNEGYSRIPVYRENVDSIVGVLLYKDVLNVLIQNKDKMASIASKTIESLIKPVVFTPETKKISVLLQEFRSKKNHLAIVVDEYGGTEGIVTIEDILEELVGEIEDEYDIQQADLISSLASGGWIIDAKMGIIDIEEEIGIQIPPGPEYDTIGGYVFHKAGSIPTKGWKVHLDEFDLEVLSSDERSINKIKITPHKPGKRPAT